ncbi:tetratricopeptide repeat protein 23-like [Amia ocellicauda]|uniref:tetratricopeptide repeat protein 23-like n=1 Tax=Amia ocellicauda TaxID=2972642 RepID=UPI003463D119|nr:TT23L protein [Amia calva]
MHTSAVRIPTASWGAQAWDLQRAEDTSRSSECIPTERCSQDGFSTRSVLEQPRRDEGTPWEDASHTPAEKLVSTRAACEEFIKNHKVSEAMMALVRCVALSRLVYGDGHWRLAESLANVAHGYLQLRGLPAQTRQHAETARDILLSATQLPELEEEKIAMLQTLLTTYYSIGVAHLMQKNLTEAFQNLQKAEKIYGEYHHVGNVQVQKVSEKDLAQALGRVAMLQRKPASAMGHFQRAASSVSNSQGPDSPELIGIYQEMAQAERLRARHEEAIEYLLQAHSIAEAQLKDSVETAQAALLLANAYAAAGKAKFNEPAEQYFKKSINTYGNVRGADSPQTLLAVDGYASWLIQTGRQQQSLDLLQSTLKSRQEAFSDYSDSVADALSLMSNLTLAGGEVKKAYQLLKKCLEIQTVLYGSQHKKSRQTLQLLDMLNKSPAVSTNSRAMNH